LIDTREQAGELKDQAINYAQKPRKLSFGRDSHFGFGRIRNLSLTTER